MIMQEVLHYNSNDIVNSTTNLEEKIKNSSPEELTLMLFNGCLQFINKGKNYLNNKQYEQANNNFQRAEAIILELHNTLNFQYPISKQLALLYQYIYNNLVSGNIKSDIQQLNDAENIIFELRDTWLTAIEQIKYEQ